MITSFDDARVPAPGRPGGKRVYRAILRAAAVVTLLVMSVATARANALTCVDAPRPNSTVPPSFFIAGWALDLAARQDTGIGQIHVWAYPVSGANPIFLGQMSRGARPDVAAAFGPQFHDAGFWVSATNLAPGGYQLVLTPFSSITNAFQYDAAFVVPITVAIPGAPAPAPSRVRTCASFSGIPTMAASAPTASTAPIESRRGRRSMNPDVITFNEIERNDYWGNEDQPEVYKNLLQQKTGKTWYCHFAQEYGQWNASGKGNLILSTYPINVRDQYELVRNADRSIALVTITVNGRDLTS